MRVFAPLGANFQKVEKKRRMEKERKVVKGIKEHVKKGGKEKRGGNK
jgi:hypothetical protein